MVQAILFWIFVAIFVDKNYFLIFFPFDFHYIHICIASGNIKMSGLIAWNEHLSRNFKFW